ncbi:hypothetical protein [Acinetobacter nosocomialis]|uniref:hypothetical protein n=1 Tax=Acinetobacter nosocomialis TaxID=106654 RepID=UPI001AE2F24E|nr:hypothetical protein [Acinetobacter nosocomialis]MBP1500138.1 hypothetical protein [Acinetobacter nosocomialis]MBR7685077.1 hypothetical protein [Acinetobacter nosocomialis]MBR7699988.1 hypothetical protein [Acinetobacter nosocomialis]MBR7758737.1 hypothetical protein [Acinetobacter nosocomialis]MDE1706816.1 hypothetical protein [Acinetobacter nosocomialis]
MQNKIFYSWQSDCPSNTNRSLINTALDKAIEELQKDKTTTINPVMDRDTLGLSGSPDITHSIFSKIDNSFAFVCDVSIIDSTTSRPTPNPNVLVELGYAIKTLGWSRIIMVMNTQYGEPDKLPFDLRSKRVLTYKIATEEQEKAPIRNSLSKTFAIALKMIFDNHEPNLLSETLLKKPESINFRESDLQLFNQFKETLPSKGSISFIDEQNMAGFSWPSSALNQLDDFYHDWGDAEHEFIDTELETIRSKLYELVGNYLGQIAINTFPANTSGRQTVPPEWEETNPKHFFEVVNKLHETAGQIVKTHQDLIRLGRQKLAP